jgi:nitrogen fixation/metabolism regulation signal transduction histidine kinase
MASPVPPDDGSVRKLQPAAGAEAAIDGVYLGSFLMVTLMILVGATWMGLYMAKRITGPVQALAAAAREIGAGHLDQRIEPQSHDEFGSLVEAFNVMASELSATRRRVDQDTVELERKHVEVETRPPLHRDHPRANHDRRRVGGRRRQHHDDQ